MLFPVWHMCHAHARPCLSTGWALNRRFGLTSGTAAVLAQGGGGGVRRTGTRAFQLGHTMAKHGFNIPGPIGKGTFGLDWIGLDWIGLDWIGLDWTGLDWIGLDRPQMD